MDGLGSPKLSIVIVNWNTQELLKNCLDSIYVNREGLSLQIIVVDNGSLDGSQAMVKTQFPEVRLLAQTENIGFAKANNIAFGYCSADYVMLLNSDTTVHPGTLERLLSFLDKYPQAGAVAPKVSHPHLRLRVLSCGYQPSLLTVFNHYFGLSSMFPHIHFFRGLNLINGIHDDDVRSVEWLSGACIVVRKSIIHQVGGLNENWFMYAEDMEWCLRMSQSGWQLFHIPDVKIDHLVGASSKKNSKASTMWVESLISYYQSSRHPNSLQYMLFRLVLVVGLTMRSAVYFLKGICSKGNRHMWWEESTLFQAYARAAIWR